MPNILNPKPWLARIRKASTLAAVTLILAACGGGGDDSDSTTPPSPPPVVSTGNLLAISVERWPDNTSINLPFASVTVCVPGSTLCETVDHVLIDTGSYGLRLVASELSIAQSLPAVTTAASRPVAECAQFVDGFTWGSVRRADIRLAGEIAPNLPVQIIADPVSPYAAIPRNCSSVGWDIGSVSGLGAKGILGIGLLRQDCPACVNSISPGVYYSCTSSGCSATTLPLASQVANPVPEFAVNNNGIVMKLPGVAEGGANSLSGSLIFGIGTQANNQLGSAGIYKTDELGNFTTTYKGVSYRSSFIDSGSNGLFFPDSSIADCSGFYCPASTLYLQATNTSVTGNSTVVNFTVENVTAISSQAVAAHLGGPIGLTDTFDWGLPFFFGRTVYGAISGQAAPGGPGPYWAY